MIVQIVYISEGASKKIYDKLVESGKDLHNRQVNLQIPVDLLFQDIRYWQIKV